MSFGGGFPRFLCVCVCVSSLSPVVEDKEHPTANARFFCEPCSRRLVLHGLFKASCVQSVDVTPNILGVGASSLCFGRRAESSTGLIEMTKIRRMGFAQHKVCKYINMYTLMLYLLGQCDTESEHLCSAAFLRNSTGTKRL